MLIETHFKMSRSLGTVSPANVPTLDACLKAASKDSTSRLADELHSYNPTLYPDDKIKGYSRDNLIKEVANLRFKIHSNHKLQPHKLMYKNY